MAPYTFDNAEKLALAKTDVLVYIETIYSVANDDVYIMSVYNSEDEAIDQAENIRKETGKGCKIAYMQVYVNLTGDYFFFDED